MQQSSWSTISDDRARRAVRPASTRRPNYLRSMPSAAHRKLLSTHEVMNGVETDETDQDQVDRDDIVQQPRHEQDQDPGNKPDQRRDMGNVQRHGESPGWQVQ